MFFAGHAADRADLRVFLAAGMLGSGLLTSLVGMGYFWKVHSMPYYLTVQVAAGLFQSTGWPAVVAVMANWFGKGKRGLVMGVWNAHTSLGNIAGTVTAAACLSRGWGWSFVLPGLAMSAVGVVVFAGLVPHPSDVGLVADGEGGGGGGGGGGVGVGGSSGGGVGVGVGVGGGGGSSKQQQQVQYDLLRSLGSQTACVRMGLGGGLGGSSGTLATATSVGAGRSSSRVRSSSSSRARGNGNGSGDSNSNGGGGGGGGGGSDSAEEAHNNNNNGGGGAALPVSGLDKGSAGHSSEDDETGLLPDGTGGGAADGDGDNGVGNGGGGGGGGDHGGGSVTFAQAWAIPGVASFAFALFFSKLIAYTFLYWLPFYIRATPIQGRMLSSRQAGDLSVLFDVGGVAGGVVAGHLSDKTASPALVSTAFTLTAVPALWLYRSLGHASFAINVALMTAAGFLVNGPYALITTAVSADLGSHESLQGNARALATVTAIIDGMGSVGAAIGPMLTGVIAESGGFDGVFAMLYFSATAAGALLVRMALRELVVLRQHSAPPGNARGMASGGGAGGAGVGLSPGVQLVGLKV